MPWPVKLSVPEGNYDAVNRFADVVGRSAALRNGFSEVEREANVSPGHYDGSEFDRPQESRPADLVLLDFGRSSRIVGNEGFEGIVGRSPALLKVLDLVRTVAPSDSTVLIEGETGSGKELIAAAIHAHSGRKTRPFIKLNCAAIPLGLLESELFGHEKGAFTGAMARKIGRFEAASGGTLLLDEIGDIPLELQAKLLRVLQEGEFERLGSTQTQRVNVRLIAATNADLWKLVCEKKFRSDFYYRVNVFPIQLPSLRERPEDIPVLARHFVERYAARMQKPIDQISEAVMNLLVAYPWPGNIRELQNFLERSVILTTGRSLCLPSLSPRHAVQPESSQRSTTLRDSERDLICRTLKETNGIVDGPRGAAARLGVKRTTLYSRMNKLGISRKGACAVD